MARANETLLIPDAVDPSRPVTVEVIVVDDALVSLEKWVQLLAASITFLATKQLIGHLAFPAALLAAFDVDILTPLVRRCGWGGRIVEVGPPPAYQGR